MVYGETNLLHSDCLLTEARVYNKHPGRNDEMPPTYSDTTTNQKKHHKVYWSLKHKVLNISFMHLMFIILTIRLHYFFF